MKQSPGAMAKRGMKELSFDFMFDILSRLPLKTVLRFACVSKLWHSVVSDPTFGEIQSSRSPGDHETNALIVVHQDIQKERKKIRVIDHLQGYGISRHNDALSSVIGDRPYEFSGTCNGLVCFAPLLPGEPVIVFNPITREHLSVPKTPVNTSAFSRCFISLGFDPSSKEYKVLMVSFGVVFSMPYILYHVYTLNSCGKWRELTIQDESLKPNRSPRYLDGTIFLPSGPLYLDGTINYLVWNEDYHTSECVESFDVGRETLHRIELPGPGNTSSPEYCRDCHGPMLFELEGRLSILYEDRYRKPQGIWVLENRALNHWNHMYSLKLPTHYGAEISSRSVLGLWSYGGNLLVLLRDVLREFYCHPIAWGEHLLVMREQRNYQGPGLQGLDRFVKCTLPDIVNDLDWELCMGYRPSLVSLKRYGGESMKEKQRISSQERKEGYLLTREKKDKNHDYMSTEKIESGKVNFVYSIDYALKRLRRCTTTDLGKKTGS